MIERVEKELSGYVVDNMVSPNSRIKFGRHSYRALVDKEAEVSVTHKRVYSILQPTPEIVKRLVRLQTANCSPLNKDGQSRLQVKPVLIA